MGKWAEEPGPSWQSFELKQKSSGKPLRAGVKEADSGCCAEDGLLGNKLAVRAEARRLVRQARHWQKEESSG